MTAHGVPVVDRWVVAHVAWVTTILATDGVHLTGAGYRRLAEALAIAVLMGWTAPRVSW
jgi:lysophospholipase L1-like esterase